VILVDASVWIAHFRQRNERLLDLLTREQVLGHPFVMGEVALGHLHNRRATLRLLAELPPASTAVDTDVLAPIHNRSLFGRGIGYVDAHLLASVLLTSDASLWSSDRRLMEGARSLGIAAASQPLE
jgi:predicted nucleic acid-binding protein